MKVIADLCVVPIGIGVSGSKEVAICERILAAAGLNTHPYAYGTNIEGDWDRVFAAVKQCHEASPAARSATNLHQHAIRNADRPGTDYGGQGSERRGETGPMKTRKAPGTAPALGTDRIENGLVGDPVLALAILALRRLYCEPHPLPKCPAYESANRMRLPAGRFHQLLGGSATRPF